MKKYFAWCQNRDKPSRMDLAGVQSPQMDWEAENLPERWKRFRQHVEIMFSGPLATKKEEEKCSYLLIWCGKKGRDIANTWRDVTDEDEKKLKTYFERFANHVEPKCNPVFFPLQVSQQSTSRVGNSRTVSDGLKASGERLFL